MSMTDSLAKDVGIKPACDALVVSRASYYRWQNQGEDSEKGYIRPLSPLALSPNSSRFLIRCMMNGLSTKRHRRFTPPFWMAAVISVP